MTTPAPEQVPAYSGCPWPLDTSCLTEEWDALTDQVRDRSRALASTTLEMLTAYRVGNCPVTVRPCRPRADYNTYAMRFSAPFSLPYVDERGLWVNWTCADCQIACEVPLPAPVGRVDEVLVDGQVVDPASYRIDDGHYLVWQGGGDCAFPTHQDLSLPSTEPGTFSITYLNAYPVDGQASYAAAVLAVEYAKACTGAKKCRLPAGVTTIVRQGVSMEVQSGAFPDGLTGMREVDSFITRWNPKGRRQQGMVWSPDLNRPRVTSW